MVVWARRRGGAWTSATVRMTEGEERGDALVGAEGTRTEDELVERGAFRLGEARDTWGEAGGQDGFRGMGVGIREGQPGGGWTSE